MSLEMSQQQMNGGPGGQLLRVSISVWNKVKETYGEFEKQKKTKDENENEHFLYDQAVRIPMNAGSDHTSAVLVSTIATFNLALFFQLNTNGEQGDNSMKLRQAVRLYEVGFNLPFEDDSVI
jgi:hypothetical protein